MLRLIIVEDEVFVRIGLEHAINWGNYHLELAASVSNGQEAWEAWQKYGADIIITDIKMPVMDGLTLIEKIRERDTNVKFIIMTCMADFTLAQKALRFGVSNYFTKYELDMEELENSIAAICEEFGKRGIYSEERYPKPDKEQKQKEIEEYLANPYYTDMPEALNAYQIANGEYCLSVLKIPAEDMDETLRFSMLNLIEELLQKQKFGKCFGFHGGDFILFFSAEKEQAEKFCEAVNGTVQYLKKMLYGYFGWIVECRVGSVFTNFDEIQEQLPKLNSDSDILKKTAKTQEVFGAITYIREHLSENILLSDVASHVNLSVGYLSYVFKQQLDITFSDFLLQMRMKRAKILLEQTDDKIYEIAEKTGYQTAGYFNKVFRRIVGISPSQYRELHMRRTQG